MPELGSRELGALLAENANREYGKDWPDTGAARIRERAEDAAGLAVPSAHIKQAARDGVQPWQGWVDAYWAALP